MSVYLWACVRRDWLALKPCVAMLVRKIELLRLDVRRCKTMIPGSSHNDIMHARSELVSVAWTL